MPCPGGASRAGQESCFGKAGTAWSELLCTSGQVPQPFLGCTPTTLVFLGELPPRRIPCSGQGSTMAG